MPYKIWSKSFSDEIRKRKMIAPNLQSSFNLHELRADHLDIFDGIFLTFQL